LAETAYKIQTTFFPLGSRDARPLTAKTSMKKAALAVLAR
jgi:hypothetical protein